MAPSPSTDATLGPAEADLLLDIAETAVIDGLRGRMPTAPAASALPPSLRDPVGVFVTLKVDGALNGCIGAIEGTEPLGHGAARNAWSAAFDDPRLPPLRPSDYPRLTIEISVLSPLEPIAARTRADLLTQLRPGVDGLLISTGRRQCVFLPTVWEHLPDPGAFLDHLQLKAGLPPGVWPPRMRAFRFTAERHERRAGKFGEPSRAA
jgi:AmmeMemoRadiSam system protein A